MTDAIPVLKSILLCNTPVEQGARTGGRDLIDEPRQQRNESGKRRLRRGAQRAPLGS